MGKEKTVPEPFENCTYFIFPLRITEKSKLDACLKKDQRWKPQPKMKTDYLLCYTGSMNESSDDRLEQYAFSDPASLPIYLFDTYLKARMEQLGCSTSGGTAYLKNISLYVFGDRIAFLELFVGYQGMNITEIVEFIYRFRSLRNNESQKWLGYPEGSIGADTAVRQILPEEESGTELCFSNPSEVKGQAIIYSMIYPSLCETPDLPPEKAEHYRYLLSHGYSMDFLSNASYPNPYKMAVSFREGEYWGGCQDGLVCIEKMPYLYQYQHLCNDYHFLYLLLLNQRFSIIDFIDEFSKGKKDPERVEEIYEQVVTLKIRYAFRIVSDDAFMQTIYSRLYEILEIDHLLKDVDEAGEQLNGILLKDQEHRDKRVETILVALSCLAVFSALVDLSDYLEKFSGGAVLWPTWVGLAVNLAIIVIALILFFRRKK